MIYELLHAKIINTIGITVKKRQMSLLPNPKITDLSLIVN